jgi:hypothetical protein
VGGGGIIFGDIHRLDIRVDGLVAGRWSPRVSPIETKVECGVSSSICNDESRQYGALRFRWLVCNDGHA